MSLELITWEMEHDEQPVTHPPPTNAGDMVTTLKLPARGTQSRQLLDLAHAAGGFITAKRIRSLGLHPYDLKHLDKLGLVEGEGGGVWRVTEDAMRALHTWR